MYLKSLTITGNKGVIREIDFHAGLNLIVDKTHTEGDSTQTGNNVGKTTVLRLIDFCLGGEASSLYRDPENKAEVNQEVKDFLINERVIVTLVLVDNLTVPGRKIVIERNFLQRKDRVFDVNGESVGSKKDEINGVLLKHIFPSVKITKPTFRQMISHNIRYEEDRLTNTLKTLGSYASDEDYETLYLYLFGCDYDQGDARTRILLQRDKEESFRRRLERTQTKGAYVAALNVIENEIQKLEEKKQRLNINPDLEHDVEKLNSLKAEINRVIGNLSSLQIRKGIIEEAQRDLRERRFDEDTDTLVAIYKQASAFIPQMQHTFEELVSYHNQMLINKSDFLSEELPKLNQSIDSLQQQVADLHHEEIEVQAKITESDTFSDLEEIILRLNNLYQQKGACESFIDSISVVEGNIEALNKQLSEIDVNLFSEKFYEQINRQLAKFNAIFSECSMRLYNEQYAIKCDPDEKKGKQVYKFAPIDVNFSTGKKQGEISCFDLAYTKFADMESIPCLHFLLNDKKELVHGNQLNIIAQIANEENIQFVASILEDKLTSEMRSRDYYVVELEEQDKLFRF